MVRTKRSCGKVLAWATRWCVRLFLAGGTVIPIAQAVAGPSITWDFNEWSNGTIISEQYGEGRFSSEPGFVNRVYVGVLLTGTPDGTWGDGVHDTYIDFAAPVENLTFDAFCANHVGVAAQVNVFTRGQYHATVDVYGSGENDYTPIDLSTYGGVTRVEIVNIYDGLGENGIGWDNFNFSIVPEPTSLSLFVVGLALCAFASRKWR